MVVAVAAAVAAMTTQHRQQHRQQHRPKQQQKQQQQQTQKQQQQQQPYSVLPPEQSLPNSNKSDNSNDNATVTTIDNHSDPTSRWNDPNGLPAVEVLLEGGQVIVPFDESSRSSLDGHGDVAPDNHNDNTNNNNNNKSNSNSGQKNEKKKKNGPPWWQHHRIKELYTSSDYWSLYIGLLTFGLALEATFVGVSLGRTSQTVPLPLEWDRRPTDAFADRYLLVGLPLLGILLCTLYSVSLVFMNVVTTWRELGRRWLGFAFVYVIAITSLFLGRQDFCREHGLGYAVFSIVIGLIVGNLCRLPSCVVDVAKDGEFFIKCSLVLLAVELETLVKVGRPAILVAWVGSPITVAAGFYIGTRLFHCNDSLSMLIAVGASWCGASAISAVAPIVNADPADVALSISVVAFGALIFTFVQAYLAIWLDLPDDVAGAWIGASVDQTGNVLVSAAIVSPAAAEIAGIVKMVLNAALGVMASVIACYWSSRRSAVNATTTESAVVVGAGDDGDAGASTDHHRKNKLTLVSLWDKFPKFTLGFVITSIILTITLKYIPDGCDEALELPKAISALNQWWFAVAFSGIGLTTNLRTLATKAVSSGIVQVYLLANLIDILVALGLAYLAYDIL
jgi:uncharacterized membrane protein YadS